ncbi:hypothetical protein [Myxococcus eversor]|nr:hypothetical protein [Myxococcus eversor]
MKLKNAVMGVVLFTMVGCGVETTEPVAETPSDESTSARLLARVERDNGNVVQFLESAPGELMVMEVGTAPNPPAQIDKLSPVDAWRALTGEQAAPEALVAAQERAKQLTASSPVVPLVVQSPVSAGTHYGPTQEGEVRASAGCDPVWFHNTFCAATYDWKQCLLNHRNGAYAQSGSVDYHRTAACSIDGYIVINVQGQAVQGIGPGQYYWYWKSGSNFAYRSDITSASGNTFHYFVGLDG